LHIGEKHAAQMPSYPLIFTLKPPVLRGWIGGFSHHATPLSILLFVQAVFQKIFFHVIIGDGLCQYRRPIPEFFFIPLEYDFPSFNFIYRFPA